MIRDEATNSVTTRARLAPAQAISIAAGIVIATVLVGGCTDQANGNSGGSVAENAVSEPVATINTGSDVASDAAAKAPTVQLGAYADKYPYDKVKGLAFYNQPKVRAAIEAAVPPGEIRDRIFSKESVVYAPIKASQGRLLATGYDPASGGDVNWAVLMVVDGSKAAVCYSTGVEKDVRGAAWYLGGEVAFTLYQKCPSEPQDLESLGNWPIGPIPG